MNDLPSGWVRITVEQLAADEPSSLTDGPFGSNLKTSHYTQEGPRVIRLQNIGDGVFHDERAHISEEHFYRLRKHEAAAGDVVIAMLGQKLPRACIVPPHVGPAIVKADCVRLRIHAGLSSSPYVAHALNSQQLRNQASVLVHGVGRPRLGLKWLRTLTVPLAPRGEQDHIVEAIESYFTRLDHAVATLERVQRNLKRYRASVLKAAVEGRLVPTEAELARAEDRDYEPASVLLERILAERRRRWEEAEFAKMKAKGKAPKNDKWKAKYKEPAEPDTSALPVLPEGWSWATVDALHWDGGYGTSQKCRAEAGGPPVLRIPNVQRQTLSLDDLKFAVDPEKLSPDGALKPGDFVFIRTNGSKSLIGRGALVAQDLPGDFFFASYLIRLRLAAELLTARWFGLVWHVPVVRDQLLRDAASSAGQHNVSLSAARSYSVPIPPLVEQGRVLSEVERLLSISHSGGALALAASTRCKTLRQSVLKWAFEGKLVDQDPSDEPAAALLDRITAERAAVTNTRTTKKRGCKKTRSTKA